jgi:hypothetical protein
VWGQVQRLDVGAAEAAAAAATLGIEYNFMRYRQGYPGEALDDRQLSSNVKFYQNEIKSAPDGKYSDIYCVWGSGCLLSVCGIASRLSLPQHVPSACRHLQRGQYAVNVNLCLFRAALDAS